MIGLATALVLAAAAPAPVDFWNDAGVAVTITIAGVSATAASNHETHLTGALDTHALSVKAGGCTYAFALPYELGAFREEEFDGAPVRLYLSDGFVLYVVPPDLGMQSPPNYLEPKQLNGFPLYAQKSGC